MKAIVDRKELLELVGKVKAVIPHRSTLPVIEGILFQVRSGKLWLTTTNLDQALTGRLTDRNKIMGSGGIVIKPKELENFLKAVNTDKVTLATVKNNMKVDAGNASTTLEGQEAKDFPPVPKVKGKEVKIVALAEKLSQVSYAAATEDSRPVLQTVYFEPENAKSMSLATADGFRLATVSATVNGKIPPMLIPSEAIELIERFGKNVISVKAVFQGYRADKYEGTQLLKKGQRGLAFFQLNGIALTTQVTLGAFPNYRQLIPTKGTPLIIKVEEFKQALKVPMAIMDKDCSPILRLHSTGKELRMWHADAVTKQVTTVKIPAEGKTKIAFNPRYLKDMVDHTIAEAFTLKTTTPNNPGLFVSGKAKYVIMPMFVQWGNEKPKVNEVPPSGPAPATDPSPEPANVAPK